MDRYDEYCVKAKLQPVGMLGIIGGVLLILIGAFIFFTLSTGGILIVALGFVLCTFSKDSMNYLI